MKVNHKHSFKPVTKDIILHGYNRQGGKVELTKVTTARDTLKMFKCETCPFTTTYDLKRKKLV